MGIKAAARRIFPGAYDFALKLAYSRVSRTLLALPALPAENKLIADNFPRFAVNISGRMGLGAVLSHSAEVFHYCDERGLLPRLMFTNPLYTPIPGEDWLDRYFIRKDKLGPNEVPLPRERFIPVNANLTRRLHQSLPTLTIQRAHDLFIEHLGFREEFCEHVDRFCVERRVGAATVGVHYRGTDKRLEASSVNWETIVVAVETALGRGKSNIFVATDEPEFLNFMKERFGLDRVADLDCKEIFQGSAPAHTTAGNPQTKAREAIESILVLSRCGMLIRSRSHLSAWAKILNPSIPVIVFGEMLWGDQFIFPEHIIQTEIA